MSKNEQTRLLEQVERNQTKRVPDARIRRTHQRLGMALVQLIRDKPMDEITVQEVLDRAGVGRSTFYLHFRDKDDLLFSQFEKFLEMFSTMLSARKDTSHRVVPITEMFEHIGEQKKFYRSLGDAGRLNDFYDLAQGYFTRGIEGRLKEFKEPAKIPARELRTRSVALAGSLLSLLRWWMDRGAKESPRELDETFHRMVWEGMK